MDKYMLIAMKEANKSLIYKDVPVGAVIVKNNKIIAKAYNGRHKNQIVTHHAEILAIEKACKKLKNWRLDGCKLYVTLEPCQMCKGAISEARINEVIYGTKREKSKAIKCKYKCIENEGITNKCSTVIKEFFKNVR